MYSRHVPLPSGGSLVIDSTEAIVAIDVNSGKFRDHSDAEMTAFKTDMEAAEEIPRQLKLRDLGGVIICDFIDLRYERHRRELEQKLHDNFKRDRAKTKVLRMSQFGIIELTRQRMRPSLKRSIYFDCPHCKGAGLVKTPESMSLDVMRRLAIASSDLKVARVELSVCADVSFYLLNKKRRQLAQLEEQTNKRVVIRTDPSLGLDEMRLDLFDARDGAVIIEELGMLATQPPHTTQLGTRPAGGRRGGGGRFDDRRPGGRGRGGRGGGRQGGRPVPGSSEAPVDIEDAEDALEELDERRERGIAAATDMGLMPTLAEDLPEPAKRGRGADDEADVEDVDGEEEEEETPEGATDIDEGPDHTIGERPEGEVDRRQRGRHGGRGGRGGGRDGGRQGGGRDGGRQGGGRDGGRQAAPQGREAPREGAREGPRDGAREGAGAGAGANEAGGGRGGRRRRRGRRGRGGQGGQGGGQQGQPNQQGGRQPQPVGGGSGGGGGGGRGDDRDNRNHRRDRSEPIGAAPEAMDEHEHDHDEVAPIGNRAVPPEPDFEPEEEHTPGNEVDAPPREPGQQGEGEGGPRKRRRRRGGRGRRGRGRNKNGEAQGQGEHPQGLPMDNVPLDDNSGAVADNGEEHDEPGEHDEPVAEQPEPVRDEPKRPTRPTRTPPKSSSSASSSPSPSRRIVVADEQPVVKTGSADKHLVTDDDDDEVEEPIVPTPLPRPRSYADLDAIPDDYE